MDEETASLFDALRHPGAALLLGLLGGAATEYELCRSIPTQSQSTINRKLHQLAGKKLVFREVGAKKQKDLRWALAFPDATEALLTSGTTLSALAALQRVEEIDRTSQELRRSRAARQLRSTG